MNLLNTQPVEKQELDPKGILDVVDIFPTIQGEGPYAGEPCVFVRLAGCNLSAICRGCDTDYTSKRQEYEPDELCAIIQSKMPKNTNLVVITGGEPFRQNIIPLLLRLRDHKLYPQIETNGTLYLEGLTSVPDYAVEVVCSPKTGKIHDHLIPYISCLKYIVTAGKVDPEDGLPLDSLGGGIRVQRPWPGICEIYVQPCDEGDPEKDKANLAEAVNSCLKFGYKLSIQLHKIANLP